MRKRHSFFHDEQGDWSMARVLCFTCILFTFWMIVAASDGHYAVPMPVWALLTSLDMALIGWAAGPRIARYLLPQVGAAVQGVAHAAGRFARTDDRWKDDERA